MNLRGDLTRRIPNLHNIGPRILAAASASQTGDEGFQKFILSTGFHPTRDLHELRAAANSDGTQQ